METFLILAGIAGCVSFLLWLANWPDKRQRQGEKQERETARQEAAAREAQLTLLKFSLTCPRCEHLALPIPETGNRYHCPDCRFQFAGDRHGL